MSDRKTEKRQFHECKQSAVMWPVTRKIQQSTSSGQESVIFPISSQLKQYISIRARPSLMTRSVAFTTDASMIFVLQANKVSPKTQKGRGRFRYLLTKNTNTVETILSMV